jgi:hypothetical protein
MARHGRAYIQRQPRTSFVPPWRNVEGGDTGNGDALVVTPATFVRFAAPRFVAAALVPVALLYPAETSDISVVVQAGVGGGASTVADPARAGSVLAAVSATAASGATPERAVVGDGAVASAATVTGVPAPSVTVLADAGSSTTIAMTSETEVQVSHALGAAGPSSTITAAPSLSITALATTGSGGSSATSGDRGGVVQANVVAHAQATSLTSLDAAVLAAVASYAQAIATVGADVQVSHVLGATGLHGQAIVTVTRSGIVRADLAGLAIAGYYQSILDTGNADEIIALPLRVRRRGAAPWKHTFPDPTLPIRAPSSDINVVVRASAGGIGQAIVVVTNDVYAVIAGHVGAHGVATATTTRSGLVVPASVTVDARGLVTVSLTDLTVSGDVGLSDAATATRRLDAEVIGSAGFDARPIIRSGYWFHPPTNERILERMPHDPGNRLARLLAIGVTVGVTVYKLGDGSYTTKWLPTLDVAHTYHGGHVHPITADEAAALTAAGYGAYVLDHP